MTHTPPNRSEYVELRDLEEECRSNNASTEEESTPPAYTTSLNNDTQNARDHERVAVNSAIKRRSGLSPIRDGALSCGNGLLGIVVLALGLLLLMLFLYGIGIIFAKMIKWLGWDKS